MMKSLPSTLAAAAVCASALAVGLLAFQPEAQACGGFFCNSNQPVDQSAERIIFSENGDGTVTAVVQILYQGPSERFAWLLPVSGAPEVGISSNDAFTRLERFTDPQYRLQTTVVGDCKQDDNMYDEASAGAGGGADAGAPTTEGGVTVVDQGSVGPYDYTTISVSTDGADPAADALTWLESNGYDLMATGPDLIRPYLEAGMNLIAFKLTKSADSGDIRPVTLRYPAELPMIPIKLTAVAARPDMGVLVWVLGQTRSIPSNYKSLVLNDALINWFNWRSTYDQVVSQAANEAGGQGFVTEYADDSTTVDDVVWSPAMQDDWDNLSDPAKWQDRHGELLFAALGLYARWDGFLRVVDEALPLPDGATMQEFTGCPRCLFDEYQQTIDGFSPQVFLDSIFTNVIKPLQETEDILQARPYITRMYTTMSPQEMTLDPVFDYNPTLGDHSNIHTADQTIYCNPQTYQYDAPWEVELPSGQVVNGQGWGWPLSPDNSEMPAALEIRQDYPQGDGEVVENNAPRIAETVGEHNETVPTPSSFVGYDDGPGDGGFGCMTTGSPTDALPPLALLALFGGGVWVARRRRD